MGLRLFVWGETKVIRVVGWEELELFIGGELEGQRGFCYDHTVQMSQIMAPLCRNQYEVPLTTETPSLFSLFRFSIFLKKMIFFKIFIIK